MVQIGFFTGLRIWILIFIVFVVLVSSYLQGTFGVRAMDFLWNNNIMFVFIGVAFLVLVSFSRGRNKERFGR